MAIIKNFEINGEFYDIVDSEAVHFTSQNLTEAEKEQARTNILGSYVLGEQNTGLKWINGKPIYRAVIETGKKTANSMKYDVSAFNIEDYISIRGMFYAQANYGEGYVFPAPYAINSLDYMIQLEAENRTSLTTASKTRTWNSGLIYIEYTKTTDPIV